MGRYPAGTVYRFNDGATDAQGRFWVGSMQDGGAPEALARMYHDKFGIETACVRIGSCLPEPTNHRTPSTWLSHDDFVRLIERIFMVPRLGCPIVYGASANSASWWDNRGVAWLGWQPQDNAEAFRAKIDAAMPPPAADDVNALYHGGGFCGGGIHED